MKRITHRKVTKPGALIGKPESDKQGYVCSLPSAFCLLPSSRFVLMLFTVAVGLMLCLLPVRVNGQEVVDKMVATVNVTGQADCGTRCLITYSDIVWQLALQPNTPLENPSSEDLNRALRLIIDQRLILQEAEKLPTISPNAEEITTARNELAKAFPSQTAFQERLFKVGLTSEKLDEILDQRIRIEKYLDFRFRNFVVITQKEMSDYYESVYVPRLRGRSRGQIVPTLEEARLEIERILTEAKIESDTDAFLDGARERAEIVMLNPI
jgi:hypothetical protein